MLVYWKSCSFCIYTHIGSICDTLKPWQYLYAFTYNGFVRTKSSTMGWNWLYKMSTSSRHCECEMWNFISEWWSDGAVVSEHMQSEHCCYWAVAATKKAQLYITQELNLTKFKTLTGWLHSFKEHYEISSDHTHFLWNGSDLQGIVLLHIIYSL